MIRRGVLLARYRPPQIQGRILTDFMDVEGNLLVTMHVRGINQNEAIKMVKRKITHLDAMKIQGAGEGARTQRRLRSGYPPL
ncbi:MAG: hypothetical protein V8S72_08130, partial [Oscillospiraceae bacterium]